MTHEVDIASLRKDYSLQALDEARVNKDPLQQFKAWFAEAAASALIEPNAMTLATVSADGAPSARAVLLKEYDEKGFVFYTNYLSRKARELESNPRAALLFYWAELERQIRIEGGIERVPRAQTVEYFKKRPRSAQIGALASEQSATIAGRATIETRVRELEKSYQGREVPCPEAWGGFRVVPTRYEFWQGRESRLHDRIVYTRSGSDWMITRLAP